MFANTCANPLKSNYGLTMSFLAVTSPVLCLGAIALLSPLVFAYTIAFIDPSYTLQRASILLLSTAIAAQLQYSVPVFTGNSTYDGVFMSLVWIFHLRAFDLLLWKAVYLPAGTARKLFCGSEPQNWPPLFGSFLDAYTLRRFWG